MEKNGVEDLLAIEGNVLSKKQFLNRLRIEKRRAERSKVPLSIILFSLRHGGNDHSKGVVRNLLLFLNTVTRETDIKGLMNEGEIGILLPDTDEKGVKLCVEKIVSSNGHFPHSVITGTYPDDIFQSLSTDEKEQPDLIPLYLDESLKPLRFQRAVKKAMDVGGALAGLILLFPVLLIVALTVKVSSPGPVIFKQTRFGKKGVRFPFYKFRSMYSNTDDRIHREYVADLINGCLEKINQSEGENPFFKMKDDPRITRVGKIIRKLSIDELPQLFNVLKGEMSLIGPRPPLPYEVEKYQPWHLRRVLEMKPGITGLWQVNGRSRTSFDEMVRLDLRYVQNWSLWLDLKILLKTIKEVIHPHGAA